MVPASPVAGPIADKPGKLTGALGLESGAGPPERAMPCSGVRSARCGGPSTGPVAEDDLGDGGGLEVPRLHAADSERRGRSLPGGPQALPTRPPTRDSRIAKPSSTR